MVTNANTYTNTCLIGVQYSAIQQCLKEDCQDGKEGIGSLQEFSNLASNFENSWPDSNWINESQGEVKWTVEDYANSTSWGG